MELIGDDKDRLCEYACGRNFEVLKWAHHELDLPWAPYPAGRVSDDVLALRVLRETWPALKRCWREDVVQEGGGVKMVDGGVEELVLRKLELCALPAEVRRLSALRLLDLCNNKLMNFAGGDRAARIADAVGPRLQSADEFAGGDRAAHLTEEVVPLRQQADEPAGGDRAAHVAEVEPRQQ